MKTKTLTHAQESIQNLILQKLTPAYNMAWGTYDDYGDYNDCHGDYYDAYHPNWDSSDEREVCPCMQEIFGKNVTTINFIQEIVNKEFYLPELQKSFEDFLRNGGVFDCSWSDDSDDYK